jgi:phospholipid/cholesterol/gamma-HCH transport system permease protein
MFGAQIFIADMIGSSWSGVLAHLHRDHPGGPLGAAFAAEIGTMKVNEELNALETMGLDPIRFLVIQRVSPEPC